MRDKLQKMPGKKNCPKSDPKRSGPKSHLLVVLSLEKERKRGGKERGKRKRRRRRPQERKGERFGRFYSMT